jgi:WD40 repeat protein
VHNRAATLVGHTADLLACCFSPDGLVLATGGFDGLRLWEVETGRPIGDVLLPGKFICHVVWSPDGRQMIVSMYEPQIGPPDVLSGRVCVLEGTAPYQEWKTHPFPIAVHASVMSRSGEFVVCAMNNGIALWNLGHDEAIAPPEMQGPCFSCCICLPGHVFAAGDWGGFLHIWEIVADLMFTTVAPVAIAEMPGGHIRNSINCCCSSPDGHYVLTGIRQGKLLMWDWRTPGPPALVVSHKDGVTACAWSPDGKYIASGAADGSVAIWDADSGIALEDWEHGTYVTCCAWDPMNRYFATGANDKMVNLWKILD